LHLVGYLYYWQMGFNSVFKGLKPSGCQAVARKTVPSIPKDLTVFNLRPKQSNMCLQGPQMQRNNQYF
jgi:hypothetical protein